jgi:uncharacterized protein
MNPESNNSSKSKITLSLDLRWVVALLLAVIVFMLAAWRPWASAAGRDEQTISVTGQAKVSAKPDEFAFHPTYQFKNSNRDAALAELTKKSNDLTAGLKKLGVADNHIKTNTSGHDDGPIYPERGQDKDTVPTYTLQITITVPDATLAQKVQDFLLTTSPTGAVSPQPTFSEKLRQELEASARDQATIDARTKAEQSAKNLRFKLGKVKSVNDGAGFGPMPYEGRATMAQDLAKSESMTIQPGENDLHYTVTVTYFIR